MNTYLLPSIIDICKDYTKNPEYVYKMTTTMLSDKIIKYYLVVMIKTPNTITNENSDDRKWDVVDPKHASYRANELKVVFIINIYDLTDRPKDVFNTFRGRVSRYESEQHTTHYIVNETVKPHRFDLEDNEDMYGFRSGGGIYFLKTLETAYYCAPIIGNYTGPMIRYEKNGKISSEIEVVDGKIIHE
jgi:hypothetical protein